MDLSKIKSAVLNQLTNTNGLYSLKIQNHIYGCFLLMEDIAQGAVSVSGTIAATPKFTFDFDRRFGEIGIRYGFAMDTKLILDTYNPEYREAWLDYFKHVAKSKNIEEVDAIEDCLNKVIQDTVTVEDGFFLAAAEGGALPPDWLDKVFVLVMHPSASDATAAPTATGGGEEPIEKTAVSQALTEKPIHRARALAKTRRMIGEQPIQPKKSLAKTRRHIK
jgi:hypothetical protein